MSVPADASDSETVAKIKDTRAIKQRISDAYQAVEVTATKARGRPTVRDETWPPQPHGS